MQDDRRRVLDMLAAGKITTTEAERLLNALDDRTSPSSSSATTETIEDRIDQAASLVGSALEHVGDTVDAAFVGADETLREDSFTVAGTPSLIVDNFNGRVEIMGDGDDGVVNVAATLRHADRISYSAVQQGDTIRIEAKPGPKRSFMGWLFLNRGAHVRVWTPGKSDVKVRSSNGRISISDLHGTGSLRTSNGRIEARSIRGRFEMATSNSRIDARHVEGDLSLESSNGRITVSDARGVVRAETSNGAIRFGGELRPGGDNLLRTSNGSIEAELKGEPSVSLKAGTSNGSIRWRDDVKLVGEQRKRSLHGVIGKGDADLTLRTSNGSIVIE